MSSPKHTNSISSSIDAQEHYVSSINAGKSRKAMGVVFADAFVRGMRDLGYKSNGYALDEMLDNAIQADASNILVAFGFSESNKSQKKHDYIAIIDDGVGMGDGMISFAVRWGGTHREGDRSSFGRYGYGLPSAAVSMTKTYTVYSRKSGGPLRSVSVDLEDLAKCDSEQADERLQEVRNVTLPTWINDLPFGKSTVGELRHCTIILLENPDRCDYSTTKAMKAKLLEHFGLIYRNYLSTCNISVDGTPIDPVDPLFLMEGCRYKEENFIRPIPVEFDDIEVRSKYDPSVAGRIKVRAAILPMGFQHVEPGKNQSRNSRFSIMEQNHGVIFCRKGRQIDVVTKGWDVTWVNYDRHIKIELDFDPVLDEYFGITTAKQQIQIDPSLMDALVSKGVTKLITQMRSRFKETLAAYNSMKTEPSAERPSEKAMRESAKTKRRESRKKGPEEEQEEKKKIDQEAEKLSVEGDIPKSAALEMIKKKIESKPYDIAFEANPEGPFFRPDQLGSQKRLIINTSHPFYSQLYSVPAVSEATKNALEVLLFSFAEGELSVAEEMRRFYRNARSEWSDRLHDSLDVLISKESAADAGDLEAEG